MPTDLVKQYSTAKIPTADIGQAIDEIMTADKDSRKPHERRWYDNNFFDDGYHFRYLSRTQNKIVDLSERSTLWAPMRAIPKASKQLRGIANLLVSQDYIPVGYPRKLDKYAYPTPEQYQMELEKAKKEAYQTDCWLSNEFKEQDLLEKLAHMVLLTGKHSISWLQVWPDAVDEKIKTQVYDAFDIYTISTLTEVEDLPHIGKGIPKIISELKANEEFDPVQLLKISPDNKHASSEIKDAYMRTRYGRDFETDQTATLILKEFYLKEYLNSDNRERIAMQKNGGEILQGKKEGDMVIRQVHSAGNIWLRDQYVNLPGFPFVDFRMEPGPMYQVPLIERFIPQNKSYDMLVSRAERFSHTMVTGAWAQKAGEQYKINNSAGGQVIEYTATPPVPLTLPSIPNFYFNLMNNIEQNIEEQGLSVSLTNKLPSGVKGYNAIESLKESEYSNLVIASRRLKKTIKTIAEKMLDIADNHFVKPKTVYNMKDNEPEYFDVIGATALKKREELGIETPDAVPLRKDYKVDIEVQSGLAYTREGQKAAAKELGDYMIQLAQLGLIPPPVVTQFLQTLLETYHFGPTKEIMESMKEVEQTGNFTDQQIEAMKIAVIEVLKDAGVVGPEADQKLVDSTKVGVVEALRDTGMIDKQNDGGSEKEQVETLKVVQDMKLREQKHQMDMAKADEEMQIKHRQAQNDAELKRAETAQGLKIKKEQAEHSMKISEKLAKAQAKQMSKMPVTANKGGSNGKR